MNLNLRDSLAKGANPLDGDKQIAALRHKSSVVESGAPFVDDARQDLIPGNAAVRAAGVLQPEMDLPRVPKTGE